MRRLAKIAAAVLALLAYVWVVGVRSRDDVKRRKASRRAAKSIQS